jgi:hypothetical protein
MNGLSPHGAAACPTCNPNNPFTQDDNAEGAGQTRMMNTPASTVGQWLGQWLTERFPTDFMQANTAERADMGPRFPRAAGQTLGPLVAEPNQAPIVRKTVVGNVTLEASDAGKIARVETLLNRMAHTLGKPLLSGITVRIDDTMGDIGRNGTGNQATYQTTRDATTGKIFQDSIHINSQFVDYLASQPVGKAEAYLAAVLFHEQSHRDVMQAAEKRGQFHNITQADEKNANERAQAGIAQYYPTSFSWLQQHYFTPFTQHFNEAYGGLEQATLADMQVIDQGNATYNQRFFATH